MSTGKDYGLPEEYHEWEELPNPVIGVNYHGGPFIALGYCKGNDYGAITPESMQNFVPVKTLVPPAPKLPEPQPVGTVIGYTTPVGYKRRAIRNPRGWDVYGPEGNILCNVSEAGMHRELQHATDYTVLVGGFEEPFGDGHSVKDRVDQIAADVARNIRAQGGIRL